MYYKNNWNYNPKRSRINIVTFFNSNIYNSTPNCNPNNYTDNHYDSKNGIKNVLFHINVYLIYINNIDIKEKNSNNI